MVHEDENQSDLLTHSQAVVRKVEAIILTYHTHAERMRKQYVHDFQLLVHMEPKVMCEMYRCLTGDRSASAIISVKLSQMSEYRVSFGYKAQIFYLIYCKAPQ